MFERFPYTNLHELNLDWILNELKRIESAAVLSVNGQTGDVILYQENGIRFPDVTEEQWNIRRQIGTGTANQKIVGLQFITDKMQRIDGTNRYDVYDAGNPPEYPVESVNGQTGAVVIQFPVTSVNGQTGAIVLYEENAIRLPNVTDQYWNLRRQLQDGQGNNIIEGIQFNAGSAMQRISGANRYTIYDSQNQPPYPVTSVNGQTGVVQIAIPEAFVSNLLQSIMHISENVSGATNWGLDRLITLGETANTARVGLFIDTAIDGTPSTYMRIDDGQNVTTIKLLTSADIPSGSGVISVNGLNGVVTLYATNIQRASDDQQTVENALIAVESDVSDLFTTDSHILDDISDAYSASADYAVGDLVIHDERLYKCTTAITGGEAWNSAHWQLTNLDDELKAIDNKFADYRKILYYQMAGDETVTLNLPDPLSLILMFTASAASQNNSGLITIDTTDAGTVRPAVVTGATNLTITGGTNTLTVVNNSSRVCSLCFMMVNGTIALIT